MLTASNKPYCIISSGNVVSYFYDFPHVNCLLFCFFFLKYLFPFFKKKEKLMLKYIQTLKKNIINVQTDKPLAV